MNESVIPKQGGVVPSDSLSQETRLGESTHEVEENRQNNLSRIFDAARRGGQAALVLAELSPVNEIVRLGAFGVGEGFSHTPVMGAVSYGLSTLVVESTGAVAAASLFDTTLSKKIADSINRKLQKFGVDESKKLPFAAKATATLIGGSVVAMAIEEREDPSRSLEQNRRYGLAASAILAGACAVQGALMAEGIDIGLNYPKPVGAAAAATAALLAGRWFGKKLRTRSNAIKYYDVLAAETPGPQIEGLAPKELLQAMKDKKTVFIEDHHNEKNTKLPLFVPFKYATWMNRDFFAKRGYDTSQMLYCSLPQGELSKLDPKDIEEAIGKAQNQKHASAIVFDYFEGESYFGVNLFGDETIDDLVTSNGTSAATYHYRVHGDAKPIEISEFVHNPAVRTLSSPEDIKQHFSRIWDIYNERFQKLVEDHPISGALKEQELLDVLLSPGSLLKAYFDKDGKLQSFGYLVSDISLCTWLNKEYFDTNATASPTFYFPGIASAKGYSRAAGVSIMKEFVYDKLLEHGSFDLTFECSNISADYIPRLVKLAFDHSRIIDYTDFDEHKYFYKVLKLSSPPAN